MNEKDSKQGNLTAKLLTFVRRGGGVCCLEISD